MESMETRDALAIDAARLYYIAGMGQIEVAKTLGVSRPTVSKMLSYAREMGFVSIHINDPREDQDAVAARLMELFGLEKVHVVRPASQTEHELRQELGSQGAALLEECLSDNMSVGISWGHTMGVVAEHIRPLALQGIKVVQLKGGHSHTERNTHDVVTLTKFARALNAEMLTLPLPVIFDNRKAKEIVVQDRHIAHMLEEGAKVDMAVFTVGDVQPENLLMNLGYLSDEEIERLRQNAIGDVCSRFYTVTGEVADQEIDARTVGITIKDLSTRPIRLLVAGGLSKMEAIRVALHMGLATHLVIDRDTAERIIEAS
ncbi:Deoxyribonucleoside regulator [Corynebacterium kutscheri]|uniref:Transcriptional regulator with sigma factor-related N-terminal domain n=2 Tax=Corynebacterium kutscheri TaxID=35755 RepID=A0A0F6R1J6_9CORY|nr:sugar-binding transcriptional regulator [Corynebacterium kutscheri]AKE41083.1 transcriptional regulator with sigma factor-related N-terminal domain [Corynebacterium kutscheri]VEH09387.1 Deoxyribonucleoside regulator [Corynebacterium kutscheri]VEH79468.1 Deoxyribonucleoside regulator [Corynebacterium kutscheri]